MLASRSKSNRTEVLDEKHKLSDMGHTEQDPVQVVCNSEAIFASVKAVLSHILNWKKYPISPFLLFP